MRRILLGTLLLAFGVASPAMAAKRAMTVDDLLAGHAVLTVPRDAANGALPGRVIERADSDRHSTVLAAAPPGLLATAAGRPGWASAPAGFEQLVLAYLRRPPVAVVAADAGAAVAP